MRRHAWVAALFVVLTLVMTWPLVARLGSGVRDPGDPLLNAWILAWNIEQLSHGNISGYFDANIFYPQRRTLAYSEHLFPQALAMYLPLRLTGNPILAHNLMMLLAFATAAFGMYLYARYLTRSGAAAIVAGVIFAFAPFMFQHLFHLQVLCTAGIPLSFLFMARFFAEQRTGDLVLWGVCFAVQALANGYYAVYLGLFTALTVAYHLMAGGGWRDVRLLARLGALALGVGAVLAPFFRQYLLVQHEMGFYRNDMSGVTLVNFLQVSRLNWLWGRFDAMVGPNERCLFPGAVALILVGAALWRRDRESHSVPAGWRSLRTTVSLATAANALVILAVVMMIAVLIGDGIRIDSDDTRTPFVIVIVVIIARAVLDRDFRERKVQPLGSPASWRRWHVVLALLAIAFSFGPAHSGPYELLHRHVPGFTGLRAIPRLHIITMFSIAALAAFGLDRLLARRSRRQRVMLAATTAVVALVELVSVPIPLIAAPSPSPAHRWLAARPDRDPMLELPLPDKGSSVFLLECRRVLHSTLHFRPMVNGFSGWMPPLYLEMMRRWQSHPAQQVVTDAVTLGVRWVVLHPDHIEPARLAEIRRALGEHGARLAAAPGSSEIWELEPASGSRDPGPAARSRRLFDRSRWGVSAKPNDHKAVLAVDGDLETRWHTAPQRPGDWFMVDLGEVREVHGLELALGSSVRDHPRGYVLEVSRDAVEWTTVSTEDPLIPSILTYLHPREMKIPVIIGATEARYLRMTTTRKDSKIYWSIHELEVW